MKREKILFLLMLVATGIGLLVGGIFVLTDRPLLIRAPLCITGACAILWAAFFWNRCNPVKTPATATPSKPRTTLENDPLRNIVSPPKALSRLWGIPGLLGGLIVGLAVAQFQSVATADAAGVSACVIYIVTLIFWDRRSEAWCAPYLTGVFLIHVFLVFLIPWPAHYSPGKQDALYGLVDLIVFVAFALLTAKLTHAPSSHTDMHGS